MSDFCQYYRNSTIRIDCRNVSFRPDILEIHENVKRHLQLAMEDVIQIELNTYQHVIYIQVIPDKVVEQTLNLTGKEVPFRFQQQVFHLPIAKVIEDVTSEHVATLPHDFPNQLLSTFFSAYFSMLKIEQHNHIIKCRYSNAYTGRRTVFLRRNNTKLPVYTVIHNYKVQLFTNEICGNPMHSTNTCTVSRMASVKEPKPVIHPSHEIDQSLFESFETSDSV